MNATFNIKVSIDNSHVTTSFGAKEIENLDTMLLAAVLKVFGDVQNKVKSQVAKFYQTEIADAEEEKNKEEETTIESSDDMLNKEEL